MKDNCGIYCFLSLINGAKYIGKSVNIKNRKSQHLNELRRGTHHSHYFQNTYNKYGEENFIFGVIEFCDILELDKKERHYIDLYNTYNNGFNEALPTGLNSGRIFSDEDKRRHSITMRKARLKMSPDAKARTLAGLELGRKNSFDSKQLSLLLYNKDTLELIYKSKSVGDCANFLNTSYKRMNSVMSRLGKLKYLTYKGYVIIRDNGKESLDRYLTNIAEHKLSIKMKNDLKAGVSIINKFKQRYNHKLALLANTENRNAAWRLNSLKSKDGLRKSGKLAVDIYLFNTGEHIGRWGLLSDFAAEYGLKLKYLQRAMCGEIRHHKNFVIRKTN